MNTEPESETNGCCLSTMLGSEDSEEETSQEEPSITRWNEMSIIERVGLNGVELSEKDLQLAFSQFALAFQCDQYTLKQRLQAEEHARNLAEENVQLELTRGRETLETLKGLCLDSKRSKILQRLQLSLDILSGTVERISNTAEVLGAVHQEARVSRAVELMVAHVDNLKRRHDRNVVALEEAKKLLQLHESCRNSADPRASPDPEEEGDSRQRSSHQASFRRRLSVSIISSQTQDKKKRDLKKRASVGGFSNVTNRTDNDSYSVDDRTLSPDQTPSEGSAAQLPPDASPQVSSPECPSSTQLGSKKTQSKNSPLDTLRHRHKDKGLLSKKKADKDKNTPRWIAAGMYGSLWRQRPLVHWLYRCRWLLLCMYLFVLFCVVMLIYYLWRLNDEAEP